MTEIGKSQHGVWQTPECPFAIEYAPSVMEEIRLAVSDAFFSVPRGGAEIGGVLFGKYEDGRLHILAVRQLNCEHAYGPSFVLSTKDLTHLVELRDSAWQDPELQGLRAVGWYHSHTRSEIFLSDADLEIHQRYFPDPWQVALVLRPGSMQPTRAGFFFRSGNGAIEAAGTYREFVVSPLSEKVAVRRGDAETGGHGDTQAGSRTAATAVAKAVMPLYDESLSSSTHPPAPPSPRSPVPASSSLPISPSPRLRVSLPSLDAPQFAPITPPRRRPLWVWYVAAGIVLLAAAAYATRDSWRYWMPGPAAPLRLQAFEREGQLLIQWDRNTRSIERAQSGSLEIADGAAKTVVLLDDLKLRAGSFTYARRSEIVELHLTVARRDGKKIEEYASFLGSPVPRRPTSQELEAERDQLAKEAEKVRADLKKQQSRTRQLERNLEQMRKARRRDEQLRRLENQAPPKR